MDGDYSMFQGPKGENGKILEELLKKVLSHHTHVRTGFHPEDGRFIPLDVQAQKDYKEKINKLFELTDVLLWRLSNSVPWFSPRYMAHMNSDISLPGIVGYFAAMLYNSNNVVRESSPVTSELEFEAVNELLGLMDFPLQPNKKSKKNGGWGHFTSGGHVANFEALWVARNLKYLPLALKKECREIINKCSIDKLNGSEWELLNLSFKEILDLLEEIRTICLQTKQEREKFEECLIKNQLSHTGLWSQEGAGIVITTSTTHYSVKKAVDILGIGIDNMELIPVDKNFRMDIEKLEEKLREINERKKKPIIALVAIFGSTEEGAIDPIHRIVEIRDKFKKEEGLYFPIHVDAAYGGYLRTIFKSVKGKLLDKNEVKEIIGNSYKYPYDEIYESQKALSKVESITIDPHKMGFIPYPAGTILFRDGRVKEVVAHEAPYLWHDEENELFGRFTMEGSRPGAAATAVWLSQKVIPLNIEGHGKLIIEGIKNAQELYKCLMYLKNEEIKTQKGNIIIYPITQPDLSIVDFTLNIKGNSCLKKMNALVDKVYRRFSPDPTKRQCGKFDYFVSKTEFEYSNYGDSVNFILKDLGINLRHYGKGNENDPLKKKENHVSIIRMTLMHPWSIFYRGKNYIQDFCHELKEFLIDFVNSEEFDNLPDCEDDNSKEKNSSINSKNDFKPRERRSL